MHWMKTGRRTEIFPWSQNFEWWCLALCAMVGRITHAPRRFAVRFCTAQPQTKYSPLWCICILWPSEEESLQASGQERNSINQFNEFSTRGAVTNSKRGYRRRLEHVVYITSVMSHWDNSPQNIFLHHSHLLHFHYRRKNININIFYIPK